MNVKDVDCKILVNAFVYVFGEEITVQFTPNPICLSALHSYLKNLIKKDKILTAKSLKMHVY